MIDRLRAGLLGAVWLGIASAGMAQNQGDPEFHPNPWITRTNPHDWTLRVTVSIRAWYDRQGFAPSRPRGRNEGLPEIDTFVFDTATVVFPVAPETASSHAYEDELAGKLTFNDVEIDATPDSMPQLYHSGTRLYKWEIQKPVEGKEAELYVEVPMRTYRTVYDEAKANEVKWPTTPWREEAASTFKPQLYVDHVPDEQTGQIRPVDLAPVKDLVREWTDGKDPRKEGVNPAVLAKFLAGEVLEHVQVSGNGLMSDHTGLLEGFAPHPGGAAGVAVDRRGSPYDMCCLLVAVYREAGLPARLVFGYDADDEKGKRDGFLEKRSGKPEIRCWVEFYLFDEREDTEGWIPVDIVSMRGQSSRIPRDYLNRPVKYFGTNDEFDGVLPIAYTFHPPTTVRAYGSTAFWGWFVTPEPPSRAWQTLKIQAITTPKTSTPRGEQDSGNRKKK